ncbi:MAG: sialate O-acetylesterase [Pseudomonadota bacterium]
MSGFGFGARSGIQRRRRNGSRGGPRITISAFSVSEEAQPGSIVGILSVLGGSGNYSFAIPAGGDPDEKFALSGANLVSTAPFDFETATSHQVTIEAENGTDPVVSRSLIIGVSNAFEQPDLTTLSIASPITQGASIAITGATTGSTIEAPILPDGWTLDSANRSIAIASNAPLGEQDWVLMETLSDSANSPNVTSGSSVVNSASPSQFPTITTGSSWDGAAGSGFITPPADPARTTAKPVLRLIEPPHQHFTDTLTVGAAAMANNSGTLIGGVAAVRFYFEDDTPLEVATPSFRTLTRVDGSTYECLGYWVDLQKPSSAQGAAQLYIEAVPTDATMQNRVIGPFLYYPSAVQHDFQTTVGTAGDHTTFNAAKEAARNSGAANPLIELLDDGDYALSQGGPGYIPTGYLTVRPAPGVSARFTLGAGNEAVWDQNIGRLWLEDIAIDLDTIAAIKTQGGAGQVLKRCRAERAGGRQLWFKNTPPDSYFVEGPAYLLECYTDGVYEVGDANALMRGTINERGFGDITSSCPATLYNTFHDWDWLDIAPVDIPRMTISYSGTGSSVTLSRSFQGSGPQTNRLRIFTLKVDGVTALTFEAWQFWDRYDEPVTDDGATPATVRGYEVQHFVEALNAVPEFSATLQNNDVAARALNLQGSDDNADFGDTEIISGDGSYDLIADIDLHAGAISGNTGENRIHLFDQITDFNDSLLWNYSQNPGYKDVIIAGCVIGQGGDPVVGSNNLIANDYSHVVFVHNSVRGQNVFLGRSTGTTSWDSYCLFSNNASPTLGDNSNTNQVQGANNHLAADTIVSSNFTGTIVAGSTASWFPNADQRDFSAAGELAANPKPPTMVYDLNASVRSNPSSVGAVSSAVNSSSRPLAVVALMGQSNMAGFAPLEAQDNDVAGIYQFGGQLLDPSYETITSDITPLMHPRTADGYTHPDRQLGAGDYFVRQLKANGQIPDGVDALVVPCARGGTSLIVGDQEWKPTAPLGELMQNAVDRSTNAVLAAQAIDPESYFAGFAWIQGEEEASNAGDEDEYLSAFNHVIGQIRANVPTAADSWVAIGSMVPEFSKDRGGAGAIEAAHRRAALENAKVVFQQGPSGHDDPSGNAHYSAAGYRAIGTAMADALSTSSDIAQLRYDLAGQIPNDTRIIGAKQRGSTDFVVSDGTSVGSSGKSLTGSGTGSIATLATCALRFEAVRNLTDIQLAWSANLAGQQAVTLRAQSNGFNATLGSDGYLCRINGDGSAELFIVEGGSTGAAVATTSNIGLSGAHGRFRVSAFGDQIVLEVSDNDGANWSTAFAHSDSTFASGDLVYMQGGSAVEATTGHQIFAHNFVVSNIAQPVTLSDLSLPATLQPGQTVAIGDATPGSVITAASLPTGWALNTSAQTLAIASDAPLGTQSWTLTEALAGATNTPRTSSGNSEIVVASGYAFTNPEAVAYVAAMAVEPNDTRKQAVDRLVSDLKGAGLYSKADRLWLTDAHDEQAARLNLIDPTGATITGAAVFTAGEGFTGSGSNTLDTNFDLNSGSNYSDSGGSIFVHVAAEGPVFGPALGLEESNTIILTPFNTSNVMFARLGDGMFDTVLNGLGLSTITNSGNGFCGLYRGSTQLDSDNGTDKTFTPSANLVLLGGNGSFVEHQFSSAGVFGFLTSTEIAALDLALSDYRNAIRAE